MIKPIYPNLRDAFAGVNAFIHDTNTIFVSISHVNEVLWKQLLTCSDVHSGSEPFRSRILQDPLSLSNSTQRTSMNLS